MLQILSLSLLIFFLGMGLVLIWFVCLWERWIGIKMPFPRNINELKEQRDWCFKKLQLSEAIPEGASIVSWEVKPFQDTETFRSHMAQITFCYNIICEGHSLAEEKHFRCLAKFAPSEGSLWNRIVFIIQGNHTKEVGFYRDLSGQFGDLVPRCYGAFLSGLTGHFCILMEQVEGATSHTEEEGCPHQSIPTALEGLAQVHAMFWNVEKKPAWLAHIPSSVVDFLLLFGRKIDSFLNRQSRMIWIDNNTPKTLLHGDARVGNMLFPGENKRFVLYDWQAARLGMPAFDVAYFLILSVEPALRVEHEASFLKKYHHALCAGGIEDYEWDVFSKDYKKACLLLLVILGLPFLSSEVSVEDEQSRNHALSGGLVWSQRIRAMVAKFDQDFLQEELGIQRDSLLKAVEESMLFPHKMNHGSRLVADHLHKNGGIDYLRSYKPRSENSAS